MASVRITKTMMEEMRDLIIGSKYVDMLKEHKKNQHILAEKLYIRMFSKKEHELMATLPDGWLPENNKIYAKTSSYGWHYMYFEGDICKRFLDNRGIQYDLEKDKVMMDAVLKYIHECEDIRAEEAKAKREVWAILGSVTTSGKLIKVWPEIESVVEDVCGAYAVEAKVPAVINAKELNEKFDLPKKEAA